MIEELLLRPYWVIDILPEQVPADSARRFARVEPYWLERQNQAALRERFAAILVKLSCYDDLRVCSPDESLNLENPAPAELVWRLTDAGEDLLFVLEEANCLITANRGDLCMTVYNPSEALRRRIAALAASEGLFFWQPPQETNV